MADEIDPPAIVRKNDAAAGFIAEAKEIDADILVHVGRVMDGVKRRGELLLKAKAIAGHGNWLATLATHWPGLSPRTAQHYMAIAKSAKLAHLKAITHKELAEESGYGAEEEPTLTEARRALLIGLIGAVDPALQNKLQDGTVILTDAELLRSVPPHCSRCDRLGAKPGRPCEACEKVRANHQADLFESQQEPEYEADPASPPKPPSDPFAEIMSLITKVSRLCTQAITSDGEAAKRLCEYMSWCGLLDFPPGGTPKFLPLVGVVCLMKSASEKGPPLSQQAVRDRYDKACGTKPWVPRLTAVRREQKKRRGPSS